MPVVHVILSIAKDPGNAEVAGECGGSLAERYKQLAAIGIAGILRFAQDDSEQ